MITNNSGSLQALLLLINEDKNDSFSLFQATSLSNYFTWIADYFLPNYFVLTDYNNLILPYNDRKFLGDMSSYRLGPASLRQLRVNPGKM